MSSVYLGSALLSATFSISPTGRKLITPEIEDMATESEATCYRTSDFTINLKSMNINWKVNKTYTITLDAGAVKDAEDNSLLSSAITVSYTTPSKVAEISSTNPVKASTNSTNNTRIVLNYDLPVYPVSGNFYIYENTSTPTLLKTVSVNDNIFSNNNQTITLDVRGLLKAGTSYYVLSDAKILDSANQQFFNFYVNQLTSGDYYYTTIGEPDFHDFIAFISSTGTLTTDFDRVRKAVLNVYSVTDLLAIDYRVRYSSSGMALTTNQVAVNKRFRGITSNPVATFTEVANARFKWSAKANVSATATLTGTVSLVVYKDFTINMSATASISATPYPILIYTKTGQSGAGFGHDVSLNSNYFISGSPYYSTSSAVGRAYVYNLSNGSTRYTLENPNPTSTIGGDYYGYYVDMNDTYIAVTSPREGATDGIHMTGAVYVYNNSDGSLRYTITGPSVEATGIGATSIAVSNNHLYISRPYVSSGSTIYTINIYDISSGSYISSVSTSTDVDTTDQSKVAIGSAFGMSTYSDITLTQLSNVSNSNPPAYPFYGKVAVAPNSTYMAFSDQSYNSSSGRVYVYSTAGSLLYTLDNPNNYSTSASDNFGVSITMNDKLLFVGANGEDNATGSNSGIVYGYELTTGRLVLTITNPDTVNPAGDGFGTSLKATNTHLIVGSPGGVSTAGSVYVFKIS